MAGYSWAGARPPARAVVHRRGRRATKRSDQCAFAVAAAVACGRRRCTRSRTPIQRPARASRLRGSANGAGGRRNTVTLEAQRLVRTHAAAGTSRDVGSHRGAIVASESQCHAERPLARADAVDARRPAIRSLCRPSRAARLPGRAIRGRVVGEGHCALAQRPVVARAGTRITVDDRAFHARSPRRVRAAAIPACCSSIRDRRARTVLLDGHLVGKTPLRLPDVRIGSHVVRLELCGASGVDGIDPRSTAGQESRVTGSLERIQ